MNKLSKFLLEIAETFIISLVFLIVVYMFIAFPIVVYGASMEPALHTGERILVERITKYFKDFERGEIVILHPPGSESVEYVKRIVGLPQEVVKIYDCGVFVSNSDQKFKLEEPYLAQDQCTIGGNSVREGRALKLGEDEFLVFGDNRGRSADSRVFGVVARDKILGRAVFRFWPLNKLSVL
ncbi:MAG: putative signal peptidase I [candidate division WWE3 bacterium GW2011_GWB1_47_11]|uniref:Signal peptidase I n=3 Tax=Katanobacteria TaxID=422282 RepID=A0A0G1RM12_UNCKA|nr:MAG: putative signal peptidase I [candidate division WWE3 bacterium GW2011_GWA2_46_9]KKU51323.1 MAG: putative signal peptidase I [candidate division WWE3 bacterium GW2011_GWC1_47_10]KKU58107.1 MAG: putative signal peptidase I [candidate division WWE3 bacterium GW2011_GWB1_47_11]